MATYAPGSTWSSSTGVITPAKTSTSTKTSTTPATTTQTATAPTKPATTTVSGSGTSALPSYYDTKTGALTDLGRAQGLPEMYMGKPGAAPKTVTPTTTDTGSTQGGVAGAQSAYMASVNDATAQAAKLQQQLDDIRNGATPLSPGEQAQITALHNSYASLIQQQQLANTGSQGMANIRGYQTGAAEYDPTFQAKVMGPIISGGLAKVKNLMDEEASAVAKLESAFRSEKASLIKDAYAAYTKAQDARTQALKDTLDQARKAQDKITSDVQSIATKVQEATGDAILAAKVADSKSVAEALSKAGDSIQKTGVGIADEYLFYKKDVIARGGIPMSFNDYQTVDSNRKAKVAAAANAGGLTSAENSNFINITNKFQNDAIIKSLDRAPQLVAAANAIIAAPDKATNQLSALYLYVKTLDPDSAVREGETALAATTQSYFSRFTNELARLAVGRTIDPVAAKNLAVATKDLVNTWQAAANKRTNRYRAQAQTSSPNLGRAFESYLDTTASMNNVADETLDVQSKMDNWSKQGAFSPAAIDAMSKGAAAGLSPDKIYWALNQAGLLPQ
jgi:hypothetical protein